MAITYQGEQPKAISLNSTDLNSVTYSNVEVFRKNVSRLVVSEVSAQTSESRVPPPYDSNGYNYSASAPTVSQSLVIPLDDVGEYDTLTFSWDNAGSGNAWGMIRGVISNWNGEDIELYHSLNQSGTMSLPLYEGVTQLVIYLQARSDSSYQNYTSHAHITLRNVMLVKN